MRKWEILSEVTYSHVIAFGLVLLLKERLDGELFLEQHKSPH
jgi:hypothetical protein